MLLCISIFVYRMYIEYYDNYIRSGCISVHVIVVLHGDCNLIPKNAHHCYNGYNVFTFIVVTVGFLVFLYIC